jgi:hypothetical protein
VLTQPWGSKPWTQKRHIRQQHYVHFCIVCGLFDGYQNKAPLPVKLLYMQYNDFRHNVVVQAGGNDQRCVFRELNSADDFTELQSVIDSRWYLGFDRSGRRLNASSAATQSPSLYVNSSAADRPSPTDVVTSSPSSSSPTSPYPIDPFWELELRNLSTKSASVDRPSAASAVRASVRRRSHSSIRSTTATIPQHLIPAASSITTTTTKSHRLRQGKHQQQQQQQLQQQQYEQQRHRVRHNHKRQRRHHCFQFVKTLQSTPAPASQQVFVDGRHVPLNSPSSSRNSDVDIENSGRKATAWKSRSSDRDGSAKPLRPSVLEKVLPPQQHGPPVNFRQVYANFGVISISAPESDKRDDLVDPT